MKIIVIGGGPGGYVAALKAAIVGADVTLIEKGSVGGTCLNQGCIPTKAFLHSSDILSEIKNSDAFGIKCEGVGVDYKGILTRKRQLVRQLVGGVEFLLKNRGVKLIRGVGRILPDKMVEATHNDGSTEIIQSDSIIIATGSVPAVSDSFKYDGVHVVTSNEALEFEELPQSIAIVGGGVIGCEFGQFFKRLGCEVTIVELADRILPMEDHDVSKLLHKELKKIGVNLLTGTMVKDVQIADGHVLIGLSNGDVLNTEKMLVSVGRKPFVQGMGLEETGIALKNGKVLVDDRMRTNIDGYYAIGDIVNSPALAHVASREAVVAVENIMGRLCSMTYHAVPRCIYTEPEIACVGMTEEQAKSQGIAYQTGRFDMRGLGKAMVIGSIEGFVKILADESGTIIGAAMAGPHVTDIVSELSLAVELGVKAEQLGSVIHPHPTISEAVMEAAHEIKGESVHSF